MYTKLKLNETTLRVTEAAKVALNETPKTADASLPSDFFFTQAEASGISAETLNTVEAFRTDFVAGVTLAGGERAQDLMVEDKEIEVASVEVEMGKDTARSVFTRKKSGKVHSGPAAGNEWEKYCSPMVSIRNVASAKTSQMGRVFGHLTSTGAERLK